MATNTHFNKSHLFTIGFIIGLIALAAAMQSLAADQSQSTAEPAAVNWIAPSGIINTIGNPLYRWMESPGAAEYHVYVGPNNPTYTPARFFGRVPASVCSGGICTVDLTTQVNDISPVPAWLANGDYSVWINPSPGNLATWQGPYHFVVLSSPPAVPAIDGMTTTGAITWSLDFASARASWFRVYLARQETLLKPIVDQWVTREDACGSWTDMTCAFTPTSTLDGAYSFYIQSWGAGGFSTGGNIPGASGWYECHFRTSVRECLPRPTLPANLAAQAAGETPVLTWAASQHADGYVVWVGRTVGTGFQQVYFPPDPLTAESLGCADGGTCTLTMPDPLPDGVYSWYIQAQGPGGIPNNALYGWVQGPSFHITLQGARNIYLRGQILGNRANVFTTVGDSITATPYFLREFQVGYNLRSYGYLQSAYQRFSEVPGNHGFKNLSRAAYPGWTTFSVLDPNNRAADCFNGETPLACELRITKPVLAFIMLGTNDLQHYDVSVYRGNLRQILDITIDKGVIPIISTIPPRVFWDDKVFAFNDVVRSLAAEYHIPLWDFYNDVVVLPDRGLHPDTIHLSIPPNAPASTVDFTPENLRFGTTMRNLRALQLLDAIWKEVLY